MPDSRVAHSSNLRIRRSGYHENGVEVTAALYAHFYNPKGIAHQSPGLRGTSYPGLIRTENCQPQRGCGIHMGSRKYSIIYSLFLALLLTTHSLAANSTLTELKAYPPDINLTSSTDSQRIVLHATYSDGLTRDVTAQAAYQFTNPKLVRLD